MSGDTTWTPAWSVSSLQGLRFAQGARHFAHVRVLPPKTSTRHALSLPLWAVASHRVCIRDVKEAFSVRPRFPESFEYLVLDVQDSEEQNLIRLFPRSAWHFILHFIAYLELIYCVTLEHSNSLTRLFLVVGAFLFTAMVGLSPI